MSKPGGAVSAGTHVGAANRQMCARQEAFTHLGQRYAGYNYFNIGKTKIRSTSKYMPHQNVQEMHRRQCQMLRSGVLTPFEVNTPVGGRELI